MKPWLYAELAIWILLLGCLCIDSTNSALGVLEMTFDPPKKHSHCTHAIFKTTIMSKSRSWKQDVSLKV